MSIPDLCERCGSSASALVEPHEWSDEWVVCAVGGEYVHSCERTFTTLGGPVCSDHASSVALALRFCGAMLNDPRAKRIEREAMEQATREYHESKGGGA